MPKAFSLYNSSMRTYSINVSWSNFRPVFVVQAIIWDAISVRRWILGFRHSDWWLSVLRCLAFTSETRQMRDSISIRMIFGWIEVKFNITVSSVLLCTAKSDGAGN